MTKKRGAEGGFAAMGTKYFETDGVEISAKQGARLVASSGAEQREKCFLGEFFRVGGFGDAAAKKSIDGLLVPREQLCKGFRRALRKCQHEPLVADPSVCGR